MQQVAAGKPLIDLLSVAYRANLPVLLHGEHGIGKSESFPELAAALGIGLLVRDLSLLEATDLTGMPRVRDDGKTHYASPVWLPTSGKGLLVFEEVNRAPSYVRSPCYELLTRRRLNDYQLPEGWLPCAAINDRTDGYSTDDLDAALLSRFLNVKVVADIASWVAWAERTGIHAKVIDFVHNSPGVFADRDANPRAWQYASNFLMAWEQGERQQDVLSIGLAGLVSDKWALAFIQTYLDQRRPLQPTEIIEAYPTHRAAFRGWIKKRHNDVVAASVELLKRQLQPQRAYDAVVADEAHKKNVEMFLRDLPPDLKNQMRNWLAERGFDKLAG